MTKSVMDAISVDIKALLMWSFSQYSIRQYLAAFNSLPNERCDKRRPKHEREERTLVRKIPLSMSFRNDAALLCRFFVIQTCRKTDRQTDKHTVEYTSPKIAKACMSPYRQTLMRTYA